MAAAELAAESEAGIVRSQVGRTAGRGLRVGVKCGGRWTTTVSCSAVATGGEEFVGI